MQVHLLVTLAVSLALQEARPTSLDLHAASGLLLDVLHVRSALTDDLGAQVEARYWLEIDRNPFFWPFAL